MEIRSVLSPQNFDIHENIHFVGENLKIEDFLRLLELAEIEIESEVKKVKNLFRSEFENPEDLISSLKTYQTSPKISRKIKFFLKKLSKLEKSVNLKENSNFSEFSSKPDGNIRSGHKRTYIKTLKNLFSLSNAEIFRSKYFQKLLKEQQISIPVACDIKC